MKGDDHVVLLAAAQRVVHQMAVGAHPDAGGVPLQIDRKVFFIDHRAVHHMARYTRRIADILLAHGRLHAVGTDQRDAVVGCAVLVEYGDAVRVLLHPRHLGGREDFDAAAFLRAFEQGHVDVSPVNHGIRIAKTLAKGGTGGDAADLCFVERVNHHHLVGVHGAATGFFADAQGVECGKGIGAELDARANFAKLRRLLQHLDGKALPHQRQRCRQAAYAAAGHQHGKIGTLVIHESLLK